MPAQSSLAVASVDGRTAVVSARANSPLALLTPRNHGHAAWVYPSNLGGGFVGQDAVRLAVRVEAGATLFLSSQAAGRAYRQSRSRFELRAEVEAGGTLIAWPDPVSCFPGADFAQRQRFALALDANLLAVDAWSAGRVACGEPWSQARLEARLEVGVAGRPVFRDGLLLDAAQGPLPVRLRGVEALATVLIIGPGLRALGEGLQARIAARPLRPVGEAPLAVASSFGAGVVLRLLAASTEALQQTLRDLLQSDVASRLGDDPWARKW